MAQDKCPRCDWPLRRGVHHDCSEALKLRGEEEPRFCPACGEPFSGDVHKDCSRAGTIVYDVGRLQEAPADETPATRHRIDEPPTQVRRLKDDPEKAVNQYVLVEQLGRGGMGTVHKAWDTKLTRWVAIKFLTLVDETAVKRFDREAKLAARLKHPHIAPIYEVGEHKGRHYIVMEYIDGYPLSKADLPPRLAIEVIVKAAHALDSAHKSGVIHRDLKPENIMLTKAGWPYLMDFGLAKAVETESSLSLSGDVMGTPSFMSPEQAMGHVVELDARSDVYSLGATLYVLLTGKRPYEGSTALEIIMKVVHEELTPPRKIKTGIPTPVEAIILKAMDKDRDRRYATAVAFASDLERYLKDEEVEARLPSISTVILRKIRRNPWPAAMALLLLTGGSIAWVAWTNRVVTPPPSRGNPASDRRAADDWLERFRKEKSLLAFEGFKPGDAELPTRVSDLLRSVPAADTQEVVEWFLLQVNSGEDEAARLRGLPRRDWLGQRAAAEKLFAWSNEVFIALTGHSGPFATIQGRVPPIREQARQVLLYKGEFTLQVGVAPFAHVRVMRGSVLVDEGDTPYNRPGLEIADYEIELTNGDLKAAPKLLGASLKDGMTYLIKGDLRAPETIRVSP